MAIWHPAEMEKVLVDEETVLIAKSNVPPGFTGSDIPAAEKGQRIITNWRELLRFLNITVTIYPNHTEIRGAIPPQIIENSAQENTSALITSSVEGSGEGEIIA
jgi:hypothetical protein